MKHQEVEGLVTVAPRLEVGKERLWRNIGVERLWVPEFFQPRILDGSKDKLCSLAPLRIVDASFGVFVLVRRFRARADDGRGIVLN